MEYQQLEPHFEFRLVVLVDLQLEVDLLLHYLYYLPYLQPLLHLVHLE